MRHSKLKKAQAEILIQVLVSIGTRVNAEPFTGPDATSGFLSECRDQARTIGEQLYVIASNTTDFMHEAHSRVRAVLGQVAALELDACWDGIGAGHPGVTAWVW